MRVANDELDASITAGQISDKCIENVGSDEDQYIEMNLGLGVLEENRVGRKRKKKRHLATGQEDRGRQGGERKRRRWWQGEQESFSSEEWRQKQEKKKEEMVQKKPNAANKDESENKTTLTDEVFSSLNSSSPPSSYLSPSDSSAENDYSSIEDDENEVYEGGAFGGNDTAKEQPNSKSTFGSPQPQPQIDHLLHTVLAARVPTPKRKRVRAHDVGKDVLVTLLNIDSSTNLAVDSAEKPAIEIVEETRM